MNKNKRLTLTKYFLSLTILTSLLLNSVPPVSACGPFYTDVLFSFDVRPDNLEEFASGKIGILRPDYARSYLIVAYRVLNGLPLSKQQQNQAVELWKYRLGIDFPEVYRDDQDISTALEKWSTLRNNVLNANDKMLSANDLWKIKPEYYDATINCTKSGFETAAKTLESRIKQYPGETENIREWLDGQDAVFSNCTKFGKLPNSIGTDKPQWLQKDRDYQIAAALFYAENFGEAKDRFEKIAEDDSSEWNKTSNYLIARTDLRMGNSEQAELHLQDLLKDKNMKEVHRISRQLLYAAANRSKTEEKFHKFSDNLSAQTDIQDMGSEIEIYTNYMDRFGFKPDKNEAITRENAAQENQPEPTQKTEPTFIGWLWEWMFGVEKTEEEKPANVTNTPEQVPQTDYLSYDYDKPTLKNSMHFSSDTDFENITETALQEDISAWIFALQSNDRKAFEYSLEMWRKTSKEHWLLAAISNAEVEYKETEKLIEQADKIKSDSPALATIKYHQVRLLIEQNKFDAARTKLDEYLNKHKNKMPLAAQNSFFAQCLRLAENLDEFLQFAQRKTIAYSSDTGFTDETSEYGKYGEIDTRGKGELLWRNRWMYDSDATEIFNKRMPLKMLMEAGLKKDVPAYLRKQILISALTRAIMIKDKNAQRKIAGDLTVVAPEMAADLATFYLEPNDLNTFKLLVNYPVMQPLVDTGFGRYTIPVNSLAYDRDNWWYREELETKNKYIDAPIIPGFLSKNDLKTAEDERQKLFDEGYAGSFLSKKATIAAKNFPNEKQLPELLYKTLQANRYGDISYDDKDRNFTRSVFQTLHKRFPNSVWAKKSPVWY